MLEKKDVKKAIQLIKKVKNDINISIHSMATLSKLNPSTVMGILERDSGIPHNVHKLALALNIDLDDILYQNSSYYSLELNQYGIKLEKEGKLRIVKCEIKGLWVVLNCLSPDMCISYQLLDKILDSHKEQKNWRPLLIHTYKFPNLYQPQTSTGETHIHACLYGTPVIRDFFTSTNNKKVSSVAGSLKLHPAGNMDFEINLSKLNPNKTYIFDGIQLAEYGYQKNTYTMNNNQVVYDKNETKFLPIKNPSSLVDYDEDLKDKAVFARYYPEIYAETGDGYLNSEDEGYEMIALQEFISSQITTKKDLCIIATGGNSMEPTIKENSFVLFQIDSNLYEGKMHIILHDGLLKIKRLQYKSKNEFSLISDNPAYQTISVTSADDFRIVGRVLMVLQRI